LPIVTQEIENVLADYPNHPYQVAFSIHELRQKLITHVLGHIPNCCAVVEDEQELFRTPNLQRSLQERVRLDTLIRGSILHLLRENADWVGCHIYRKENSSNADFIGLVDFRAFKYFTTFNKMTKS